MSAFRAWIFLACTAGVTSASAHDLMASVCTVRATPDGVELTVKVAAEALWPVVQDAIAPGVVMVLEEFDQVAKPLLVTFAATMEELSIGDVKVAPRSVEATVAEDNFVFTFTFARPRHEAVVRVRERYLTQMPAGYVSRVMLVDGDGLAGLQKVLTGADRVVDLRLPTEPAASAK